MLTNQTGRSMVEMLGVLAIAAIITLGGLSGYRMAMNKFRANGIAELIAIASIYAQAHNTAIASFSDLEDEYDEALPECVSDISAGTDGKVTITFEASDHCADIMSMVGASFGKCRWTADDTNHKGSFNPTADAVKADGTCA